MRISLRPATVDDAEAATLLHLHCHEEAYARHLPPEFFAQRRRTVPERVESLRLRIESGHIPMLAYDDDGGLVGMAAGGPAHHEDAPAPTELYMLYTLERVHGSGAGQQLLDAVIGSQAAYLWVLEDNPRAQAFYRKNGFALDGARDHLPAEWHALPEVRMVRAARTARPADGLAG